MDILQILKYVQRPGLLKRLLHSVIDIVLYNEGIDLKLGKEIVFVGQWGGRGISQYINDCAHVCYKNDFWPSTETSLTFSQLQYQNFLKTFLPTVFELQCFAYAR